MNYLFKIFIFSSLLVSAILLPAQVTSVQYAILYNTNTQLVDCFVYINEGQATSVRERVQFNAQYSLLIPTGAEVDIESHMPIMNNQNFQGQQPLQWSITSLLKSPEIYPDYDFYGITPTLAPAGFYNKLYEGELVKIFSLNIKGENIDFEQVRIFDNSTDPKSNDLGMKHGDFSNGFTMGGYHQLYNGIKIINLEEGEFTSLEHEK